MSRHGLFALFSTVALLIAQPSVYAALFCATQETLSQGEKYADQILRSGAVRKVEGRAGYYMDRLQNDLQFSPAVTRRPSDDTILLCFDTGYLFSKKSIRTHQKGRSALADLARLLRTFKGTAVVVQVFTDSPSEEKLAQRRAKSVKNRLQTDGIAKARIAAAGALANSKHIEILLKVRIR
ncbi:MAG: OmpA family protein [Acidiferrobacterales bacterium]